MEQIINSLAQFWEYTGFANVQVQNLIMIAIGIAFVTVAIVKEWEPMLLVPIGFGMIIGNIPMFPGLNIGIYEDNSVLNILYQGVKQGWYPPLIFLGIGAMTDFSALISQPRLILIGAAAQMGIFGAYLLALLLGFMPNEAGAIGIIGGADGPTAIFLSSKLAPDLMGAIAVSAYSYMALVPVIQRPIMLALTNKKERLIRMPAPRQVSQKEKIIFPVVGFLTTAFIVPSGLPLLGMLFFGNLLKESGVTRRLAETARGPLIDTITILIGLTVGASTQADKFLSVKSLKIFGCRCFRRAGQRPCVGSRRTGERSFEPSAHARNGSQCGRRNRLCRRRRYLAELLGLSPHIFKYLKYSHFPESRFSNFENRLFRNNFIMRHLKMQSECFVLDVPLVKVHRAADGYRAGAAGEE